MCGKLLAAAFLFFLVLVLPACEVDTVLRIEGGNPPKFVMSGSGTLGRLFIRGPKKQRDALDPSSSIYWQIESKDDQDRNVGRLSPIVYGKVPEGYTQVYPEYGEPPPLVEDEKYYVSVDTIDANGAQKYFVIHQGRVEFADSESELSDKLNLRPSQ